MSNKQRALTFLKLAASGQVRSAYDQFVATSFIHHNQYFKGDRNSLLVAMEESSQRQPNKSFTTYLSVEEKDLIVTYSHVKINSEEPGIAVTHIFRFFENEKIVELWDLGQVISKDSPNENGMF